MPLRYSFDQGAAAGLLESTVEALLPVFAQPLDATLHWQKLTPVRLPWPGVRIRRNVEQLRLIAGAARGVL